MFELKGRVELMYAKLHVEEEEPSVAQDSVHVYRDDSADEYGFGVPPSAEEEEPWDTFSDQQAAEENEGEEEVEEEGDVQDEGEELEEDVEDEDEGEEDAELGEDDDDEGGGSWAYSDGEG
jgi:hypothetical protein